MKSRITFSLGLKFSVTLAVMGLAISVLVVFLGYQNYTQQILDRYRYSNMSLVSTTSNIVDWDRLEHYATTKQADAAYEECLAELRLCARAGNAQYIYVFVPTVEGCIFVFDTDEEDTHLELGELMDWEEAFGGFNQKALDGKALEIEMEDIEPYGWLLTFYTPFSDSQGKFVGYLGIDYSAVQIREEQRQFIIELAIATLIIAAVITAALIFALNLLIIRPFKKIASAANSYLVNTSEAVSKHNSITKLNVKTKDELEGLSHALQNMESKIQLYLKSLEETTYRAETDSMTNLLNREAFEKRVRRALESGSFTGLFVFLMMDIDNFKNINDTWGHNIGDEAIIACAKVIKSRFRPGDLVARAGGDEFVVFYWTPENLDAIERRVASINHSVSAIHIQDGLDLTVSIGAVALDATQIYDYHRFYVAADKALYDAKAKGRDGYTIKTSLTK